VPVQVVCRSCTGTFLAPDSARGKRARCPSCGGEINIPNSGALDDILEPEITPVGAMAPANLISPQAPIPSEAERKPCPMCGELIQRSAVKCRFCGEVFDPKLRASFNQATESDTNLSVVDWVVAVLGGFIGCIVGIIYICQGKPKGTKVLLISIAVPIIFYMLLILIAVLAGAIGEAG
jgi:predicted RNA-binding Zn-ribbon protein involved in translation (DUF1610 family)